MQHPLNSHCAIKHAEENHITTQGCDAQAGSQVLAADVTQRGTTNTSALFDQLGDKNPGIGPAVLGDVIADVEEVLPRLRREGDWCYQVERLPPI